MRISDWSSDVCSSDLLDNVYVRTERYSRQSKSKFYQLSGRLEQRRTDSFKLNLLGGFSKSKANIPVETTLAFDDTDATGYHYDYSNMKYPLLSFGAGIDDPAAFELAEFRDRPSFLTNKFKTFAANFDWDVADRFKLLGGGFYRQFDRSEEHTSELQSLMRTSYAVFCLQKNNYQHIIT